MPKTVATTKKCRLIAAVRAHKVLYDPTQTHLDNKTRNRLWCQIAVQCGIKSGKTARLMWKSLRNNYRFLKQKPNINLNEPEGMFYKLMKFLDPQDRKQESVSAVPSNDAIEENAEQDLIGNESLVSGENQDAAISEPITNGESIGTGESLVSDETLVAGGLPFVDDESMAVDNVSAGEFTTIQYWNDAEDEPATDLNINTTVKQSIAAEVKPETKSDSDTESYEDILLTGDTANNSSLKMFFDAMFASASLLPENLQRIVKKKIFCAILEGEEDAEKQKNEASATNTIRIKRET